MTEYPVELVKTVVADDDTAIAAARVLDVDPCSELVCQLVLKSLNVGVQGSRAPIRARLYRFHRATHQCFGVAHRQALLHHEVGDLNLLTPMRQAEQRPRMAHLELSLLEPLAHFGGQLEQTQQIAD